MIKSKRGIREAQSKIQDIESELKDAKKKKREEVKTARDHGDPVEVHKVEKHHKNILSDKNDEKRYAQLELHKEIGDYIKSDSLWYEDDEFLEVFIKSFTLEQRRKFFRSMPQYISDAILQTTFKNRNIDETRIISQKMGVYFDHFERVSFSHHNEPLMPVPSLYIHHDASDQEIQNFVHQIEPYLEVLRRVDKKHGGDHILMNSYSYVRDINNMWYKCVYVISFEPGLYCLSESPLLKGSRYVSLYEILKEIRDYHWSAHPDYPGSETKGKMIY